MRDLKKEALLPLSIGLNTYSKVMLGRAYDAGYQRGKADGAEGAYLEGFTAANRYGSKAFIACTCLALRKLYRFGPWRMQKVCNAIQDELLYSIDINETVKRCEEEFGLILEDEVTTPPEDD